MHQQVLRSAEVEAVFGMCQVSKSLSISYKLIRVEFGDSDGLLSLEFLCCCWT